MKHLACEVTQAAAPAQLREVLAIRRRVFVEEQGVPEELEFDADDARAVHALAAVNGVPVGAGRMVGQGGSVKIGRMAVLREYRGVGIGRAVLEFLIGRAHTKGYRRAILHAQVQAEGFYLKCGFRPEGPVFDEAGLPHRKMARAL
ncbi:MAG: GNAT family N-acetyltransferase [Candidatus Binataceae bacterium]